MSRARCERCLRPGNHCLCALIPRLDSRTRVLLLQHPSEVSHALNTARLAALGLVNAQLVVGEVFEGLETLLNQPGYRACLLFPGEDAQVLAPYAGQDLSMLLVVPDGTWRKARKLLHLNPLLAALPRVTLGSVPVSRYRLRKAPGPDALSTLEAVTHALQALEPEADFSELLRPFDALIEGQIEAMGHETYKRNHADH
ncbi:DTW domain-containing protein [Pseudomonas cichorii]|nr:DTW domain-containing protein [Pseudomonas cichorii]GFM72438.1 DTW domain-containing protein [Pseudomonas cichorii]